MRLRIACLVGLVLLAAGCGVRNSKPYNASPTAACLRKHGFTAVTTDPLKVGVIAGFADRGGIRASSPTGNALTIAFAADATQVGSTEQAFRSHAPAALRPHMGDIMEAQRNAVLVWTITPVPAELDAAQRCLAP